MYSLARFPNLAIFFDHSGEETSKKHPSKTPTTIIYRIVNLFSRVRTVNFYPAAALSPTAHPR